ncbi:hypothetical protein [Paracoccus sp. KR1-242]|uniref:hypothetical protein n=1 Tax=Paracoccus sp. KR1-242 TaxID=3410028 RepID=UPI003C11E300
MPYCLVLTQRLSNPRDRNGIFYLSAQFVPLSSAWDMQPPDDAELERLRTQGHHFVSNIVSEHATMPAALKALRETAEAQGIYDDPTYLNERPDQPKTKPRPRIDDPDRRKRIPTGHVKYYEPMTGRSGFFARDDAPAGWVRRSRADSHSLLCVAGDGRLSYYPFNAVPYGHGKLVARVVRGSKVHHALTLLDSDIGATKEDLREVLGPSWGWHEAKRYLQTQKGYRLFEVEPGIYHIYQPIWFVGEPLPAFYTAHMDRTYGPHRRTG